MQNSGTLRVLSLEEQRIDYPLLQSFGWLGTAGSRNQLANFRIWDKNSNPADLLSQS